MNSVAAQIFSIIAYVFILIGLYSKQKKYIILLQAAGNIFLGISYLFFNSYSTLILCIIAIYRFVMLYFIQKHKLYETQLNFIFIISIAYCLAVSIWNNQALEVLPLICNLLYTFAVCFNNLIILKSFFIVASIINIIFCLLLGNYSGAIGELAIMTTTIVAVSMHVIKKEYYAELK